jgi:hypothetical protein
MSSGGFVEVDAADAVVEYGHLKLMSRTIPVAIFVAGSWQRVQASNAELVWTPAPEPEPVGLPFA